MCNNTDSFINVSLAWIIKQITPSSPPLKKALKCTQPHIISFQAESGPVMVTVATAAPMPLAMILIYLASPAELVAGIAKTCSLH